MIPKMLNWYEDVPENLRQKLSDKAMEQFGSGLTGTTGERLYKDLAFSFKMKGSEAPEKDASKWLSDQGIPGIQYENLQMIRGEGRDTNNYVFFEPEKVKIKKINDQEVDGLLEPEKTKTSGVNKKPPSSKFNSYELDVGGENPAKNEVNNSFFRLKDKENNAIGGVWGDVYKDNLQISYASILDPQNRGKGIYTDFLKEARKDFNIISDIPDNNAVKSLYKRLGAKEMKDGRFFLPKIETE
jgi:hypothetical protein